MNDPSFFERRQVYCRFVHLASNREYATMLARLRMNVIGNPGVDKADFELWSLAVSATNGSGACIDAHEKTLQGAGVPAAAIQAAVHFAAVIQSVAVAIEAGAIVPGNRGQVIPRPSSCNHRQASFRCSHGGRAPAVHRQCASGRGLNAATTRQPNLNRTP